MSNQGSVELLTITMRVTDVESIRHVFTSIDDLGSGVQLETIALESAGQSPVEIDLTEITPKQWEALSLAFEQGYYDQPRTVDLETLAEELSISKSAVSQRLRAAEATIMESIMSEPQPVPDGTEND